MLHFPENVRLIRDTLNLNQIEFARLFDIKDRNGKISKDKIWTYENGKAKPSDILINKIAQKVGVSPEDLKNKKLQIEDFTFTPPDPAENIDKPLEEVNYQQKYIALLEKQVEEKDSLLKDMKASLERIERTVKVSLGYAQTLYLRSQEHFSLTEQKEFEAIQRDMDKLLAEAQARNFEIHNS